MRSILPYLAVLGLFAALAGPAFAEKHEDEKLGYSLIYPRKWRVIPFGTGRDYVVAKFESDRTFEVADPQGFYTTHKPWIEVVVIPLALVDRTGATVEKTDKGVRVQREIPFKSVKEYLEQKARGIGGFFFSGEKTDEINGMKVTEYEVTIDKLVDAPKKLYGWEFRTEDALWGLVAETLVKFEDKVAPEVLASFRTMKTFPRTGTLPNVARTGDEITIKDPDEEKKKEYTEEELRKMRDGATERVLSDLEKTLGREWNTVKSKNFIAVSHADSRYTRELLQHAEALRKWLDDNLGYVGSGYVGQTVITICADEQEHTDYQRSRGWFADRPEVVTYKDKEGWSDWAMQSLNRGVYRQWLKDKNENLLWGAPSWMDWGLDDLIAAARTKGRGIEFKFDTWDATQLDVLRRENKLMRAEDFFLMTGDDIWGGQESWDQQRQIQFFIRFLLVGGASRGKYKNVFSDYVKGLIFALDEAEMKEDEEEDPKEPQSEEEEDRMYKERQEKWRKEEKEQLKALYDRVFGEWDSGDWDRFNALYWREIK